MVLSKLISKLKRKRKYLVQLPRKGGRVFLGKIECNYEELHQRVVELLEERKDMPLLAQAKYVLAVDADSGQEHHISNPFFAGEEEEADQRGSRVTAKDLEELKAALQMDMITSGFDTAKAIMQQMGKSLGSCMGEMVKSYMDTMNEFMRSSMGLPTRTTTVRDWAQLIWGIIEFARNYDKIKPMVQDFWEFKEKVMSGDIEKLKQLVEMKGGEGK